MWVLATARMGTATSPDWTMNIYCDQQKGLRRALLILLKAFDYLKLTVADVIATLPR
jgi:hypothetical protein